MGAPADALYTYRSQLVRVVDGDTLELRLDLGLRTERVEQVRLLGVNCPETRGPSREAGLAATAFARDWLAAAVSVAYPWPLVVRTMKDDSFGRWLAVVWRRVDDAALNDALVAAGHAAVDVR